MAKTEPAKTQAELFNEELTTLLKKYPTITFHVQHN